MPQDYFRNMSIADVKKLIETAHTGSQSLVNFLSYGHPMNIEAVTEGGIQDSLATKPLNYLPVSSGVFQEEMPKSFLDSLNLYGLKPRLKEIA